jgi:hypothetical protein
MQWIGPLLVLELVRLRLCRRKAQYAWLRLWLWFFCLRV